MEKAPEKIVIHLDLMTLNLNKVEILESLYEFY